MGGCLGASRVRAIFLHANVRKLRLEIPSQSPRISAYLKACDMSDFTKGLLRGEPFLFSPSEK